MTLVTVSLNFYPCFALNQFESSTLALPGRVVPSEKIYQKGKSVSGLPLTFLSVFV